MKTIEDAATDVGVSGVIADGWRVSRPELFPPLPVERAGHDDPAGDGREPRRVVVVGCDGEEASDPALRFAAREAQLREADLLVVVAYLGCVDPDLEGIETPEPELVRRARALGEQSLARALGVSAGQVLVHRVVAHEGSAADVLRTYEDTAEMIIVGAHQRGMVRRLLHGPSTSHGLIEHSRVPVVVVPHD